MVPAHSGTTWASFFFFFYSINVWFISGGEKTCATLWKHESAAGASTAELCLSPCILQTLISRGHLWRAHKTDALPCICHVIAYSSALKRSCENKQQLTLCHIWQWSSGPHGASANPFLRGEKGGEFYRQPESKQIPATLKTPRKSSVDTVLAFHFLHIIQESYFLFTGPGPSTYLRCTNVHRGSFSIHGWDDFL